MQDATRSDGYLPSLGPHAFRDVPLIGRYDVVVVGGGPAGIAASTTAAELGHRTLLIERLGYCGGAAVSGMSGTICGLYMTVDEPRRTQPRQVIFGFAERFPGRAGSRGRRHPAADLRQDLGGDARLRLLQARRHRPDPRRRRRCLYHTQVIDVAGDDGAPEGGPPDTLVLHTKSGFAKVSAARIVDASGDADVVFKSGLRTTKGNNGVIQNPTMMFKVGNVDVPRYLDYWGEDTISPPKVISMLEARDELVRKKVWLFPTVNPREILVNATKITGFDGRALDVTDPIDHTEAEQFSIYQARAFFAFMKENIPGCENAYFIGLRRRGRRAPDPLDRRDRAPHERGRDRQAQARRLHRAFELAHRAALRRQAQDGVADRRLLRGAVRHPRAARRAQHHRRRPLPQRRSTRRWRAAA